MIFSSIHFIFVFLPIFLLSYFLIPKTTWRQSILLIGSLVFIFWSDPRHLHIIFGLAIINYLVGRGIDQKSDSHRKHARFLLVSGIVINVAALITYKYTSWFIYGFGISNLLNVSQMHLEMPIGISYITFSAISYLLDVHHGTIKAEIKVLKFLNYLLMFPKILQGPIARFEEVKNTDQKKWLYNPLLFQGVKRFTIGLGKKVLLADNFTVVANGVFNQDYSLLGADVAWFGLIAYALQIYFDFSGYTDMAIGIGLMLGFSLPENFNFPYMSKSITEFWQRWHITLSRWFRLYLFIPLEYARKKEGKFRQPTNILIIFLLTGLWHGAGWNFAVWGLYYGFLLSFEAVFLGKKLKKWPVVFQHLYAMISILLGWVIFRVSDANQWLPFLNALFFGNGFFGEITLHSINLLAFWPLLIVGVFISLPVIPVFRKRVESLGLVGDVAYMVFSLLVFIFSIGYLLSNGYQSFMYAQF